MPWNGSGTFNRIFSWIADKAAGLDISSTRMDADTNDLAANGFGNCLTRDGQGQPSANLPMNGFRHTGVQNAVGRTDYAALGQLQDGLANWTTAGGSSDALTATYTPPLTFLNQGQLCFVEAIAANTTTAPTFAPNGLPAHPITKNGAQPLAIVDIAGNRAQLILRYDAASGVNNWELLNPSNLAVNASLATTGDVKLTIKLVADPGWLMFDDSTFGSATSGSNSSSASYQALFLLMFAAPFTDATAPLFTSTGAGTTRAAQGSGAAAWAANCRMSLPKVLGRALAIAGAGSGLTARALGSTVGLEAITLIGNNLPAYTPSGTVTNGAITTTVTTPNTFIPTNSGTSISNSSPSGAFGTASLALSSSQAGSSFAGAAQGGTSTPFSVMQPSSFFNAMVKT